MATLSKDAAHSPCESSSFPWQPCFSEATSTPGISTLQNTLLWLCQSISKDRAKRSTENEMKLPTLQVEKSFVVSRTPRNGQAKSHHSTARAEQSGTACLDKIYHSTAFTNSGGPWEISSLPCNHACWTCCCCSPGTNSTDIKGRTHGNAPGYKLHIKGNKDGVKDLFSYTCLPKPLRALLKQPLHS